MAKIRKIYDQTIKPDGSKTTIYPITSTRAVFAPDGTRLDKVLANLHVDLPYIVLDNTSDLPLEENHNGYLIGENLYVWVGAGGDTLDGKYQNCGPFKGPKGDEYPPDEEDLTRVNVDGTDVLKFKDKVYDPLTYSGMGRKILRKNIVEGVNTLTQSMMQDTNTIYIIQYDFTLGEDITIPANCVLEFDGGSISGNGDGKDTISGNNTSIQAGLIKIFNTNVTIAGSWNVVEAYPEWFGAVGDGLSDDTKSVSNALKTNAPVYISKKHSINETLVINNSIYGAGEICFVADSLMYGIKCTEKNDINISGIKLNGGNKPIILLELDSVENISIKNCSFINVSSQNYEIGDSPLSAIHLKNECTNVNIEDCSFADLYCKDGAASFINIQNLSNYINIVRCRFDNIISNNDASDADCVKSIGTDTTDGYITIRDCSFKNFGKRAIKSQTRYVVSENNKFYVNYAARSVIDFQRGYGKSLNDTIYLNFSSGGMYGIEMSSNFNYVNGLKVFARNSSDNSSCAVFVLRGNILPADNINNNNVIKNVYAEELMYFARIEEGTAVSNLTIRNCTHIKNVGSSVNFSIKAMDNNCSVSNSEIELRSKKDIINYYLCNMCRFISMNGSVHSAKYARVVESNQFSLKWVYGTSNTFYNCVIENDHAIFYTNENSDPSGKTSSKFDTLRNCKVGDIVYVKDYTISNDTIIMGYICISGGSNTAAGNFIPYSIPIQIPQNQ